MPPTTSAGNISNLITPPQSSTTPPPALGSQLGEDAFLKLLTAQLQNQNPLNPLDDTQSIAQLAQFSSVQATTQLKDSFTSFESNFSVLQSAALIGKAVSAQTTDANGNTTTVTGTIKTVSVVNGLPEFTLVDQNGALVTDASGNPVQLPTSAILSIG